MTTVKRLSTLALLGTALALLAVPGAGGQTAARGDRLEFGGYEVYHVRLARPFTAMDAQGEAKTYRQAYLVRLKVSRPGFWGEKVDYFVGDYRVPEYGGWAEGIYFKIYDPARFAALRGGELRYRVGDGEIVSFDRRFEIGDLESIPETAEAELIPAVAPANEPR